MRNATGRRSMLLGIVFVLVAGVLNGQAMTQQLGTRLAEGPKLDSPFTTTALARVISIELREEPFEQALRKVAKEANLRVLFSTDGLPANKNVSLSLSEVTIASALSEVMSGTNLDFLLTSAGLIVVVPKKTVQEETGTIVGRVLEARTNKPLIGANVMIEGTGLGASADAEGNFRIERVPPGKFKLRASVVGYGKVSKDINVVAGQQTNLDFLLDETTVGLDEVVVTGVAFETRRKEIPADIAVITSKQIEQKHASNITELLKGEIPGLYVMSLGQFDYQSYFYVRGAGTYYGSDYSKTYIDGIELTNPNLLSTIDPKSIERVEVIRGPHAAALYGSEAMGGVIQIITKKGGNLGLNRPIVNAMLSAGYIEVGQYGGKNVTPSSSSPLKTDNSIGISGGQGTITYRVGLSYATVGEWMRNYDSKTLGFSGGMRFIQGPVTGEITALWMNRDFSMPSYNYWYDIWPTFAPSGFRAGMIWPNLKMDFNQSTLGLNVTYQALPNWVHSVVLGQDNNAYDRWQVEPHYLTASDTLVNKYNFAYSRRSIRYNTSYKQEISDKFSMRLTAGAEYSLYNNTTGNAVNIKFNEYGDIVTTNLTTRGFTSQESWTSGYLGMIELGYQEQLYVTLSSAVKQDPRGADKTLITPPRVGASYSLVIGSMELRVRGQYGTAIKPVNPAYVNPAPSTNPSSFQYVSNIGLVPEQRGGWDAGFELYWGKDASLGVTRFDENAKDGIHLVTLDAGPPTILQYQNIGEIGMAGYELQGKLGLGRLGLDNVTLSANYAYSDNTVKKLSNRFMPGPTTEFQIGDRVYNIPKHSGMAAVSVSFSKGSATLDCQFRGGYRQVDWFAWRDYLYGSAPHRDAGQPYSQLPNNIVIDGVSVSKTSLTRSYMNVEYPTYFKFGLRADREVMEGVSVFLNVTDLFNDSTADYANSYVSPGRTTVVGLRVAY